MLVSGCHPGDCHYNEGNYYARRRLELLERMLPAFGIEPERFHYTWVSASEGARWAEVVEQFTERVKRLHWARMRGGLGKPEDACRKR